MTPIESIHANLNEARKNLDIFLTDENAVKKIAAAGDLMVEAIKAGNKIISCGNGGSICDAMHFAEELSGKFRKNRVSLPAIAIADPSHISCVANDFGYEFVFSRFVEGLGQKGDLLLAITTSGNSENILNAAEAAHNKGMNVIGLTGKDGGKFAAMCDIEIRVPNSEFADRAQEIHIKIIHCLIHYIELKLNLIS
ncbi:MAG: phosphoheptose isomerase [Bacteroidetes bacterium RIFOXYA12_FULL_35_11]|nr:MAG: phosphoheptose isomerase [Bacteroidetes bacterium GWF2_35_48]OFY80380.1 MAG: phosphoheptose isomerase [Bacteroidetes bacterium RIFOXYA12_FULL_35_11]OFY92773.1 MAG: phosphoheptose isomerase [Bacteroidetes bacterium RIFOXYC12_FULL_35_7]OFY96049.1 MAG: phosphoheptose isomerase [Bacteroidetes bacterium RIFOXYB2_FULL_35_7]HBX50770.1 D-sedoheptulose 7-phosphate isomerase [Bacteroidales bacterium]